MLETKFIPQQEQPNNKKLPLIILIISLGLLITGGGVFSYVKYFRDTDKDGLRNYQELPLGTDIKNPDTDGDGYLDGEEITQGSDPLDSSSIPATTGLKILAPDKGVYLGAYDFGGDGIKTFEQAIGTKVAIGNPSYINDGGTENTLPCFDTAGHERAYQEGYTTTYEIEAALGCDKAGWCTKPLFTPQDIINGKIDNELKQVAQEIKKWGRPIFWLYPREPLPQPGPGYDGGGYGPKGTETSQEVAGRTTCQKVPGTPGEGYVCPALYNNYGCSTVGDAMCLDGPERYRDMNKHIHDVVESVAPNHLTWVMGANTGWQKGQYKMFYPENKYVDWHAFDRYEGGEDLSQFDPYNSWSKHILWDEALSLGDKPIMILEFGVYKKSGERLNNREKWFKAFLNDVRTNPKMKNLKAFMYWQVHDTRIESSDLATQAWQQEIKAHPNFWLSSVKTGGVAIPTPTSGLKILAPDKGVYLGAYDFGGDGIKTFEQAIGTKVAIGNPSYINDGGTENTLPCFDTAGHERAYQEGYTTTYEIEAALGCDKAGWCTKPLFTPQDIINGKIDNELKQVAQEIKKWGRPIFWLYPREPICQPGLGYDGGGYGLNGLDNKWELEEQGGDIYNQYNSPYGTSCNTQEDIMCLDGPERYRDMCRHVHDVVESVIPNHITWVMGAPAYWKWVADNYDLYYPGDNYVDWHAFDAYPCGLKNGCPATDEPTGTIQYEDFSDLTNVLNTFFTKIKQVNPNKPIMFVEFGVGNMNGDRSQWFNEFFQAVKTTHKQLGAFMYWQAGQGAFDNVVTRIEPSDPAAQAWQAEIQANPNFWLSSVKTNKGAVTSGSPTEPTEPTDTEPIPEPGQDDDTDTGEGGTDVGEGETGIRQTSCYIECMAESGNTDEVCRDWCSGQGGEESGEEDEEAN